MSLADVTSTRSSPIPPCPECDATASVTSDLHKYQVACTCKRSAQYACADEPGPPPPAKVDIPPALPPRPSTTLTASRRNHSSVGCNGQDATCRRRKYAWWCVGCGALAAALGGLLAAQHIVVRAYTASPHHLETVPAAVPAAMLVLTGVCIMSLARRRNRYSYMIKVVGACCLMCALTCVLVTITTTVIHMNKLQTLKFCEYTQLTRTCTCFSASPQDPHPDDEGIRCVFEGVSECGVVHGALYWCLRGVFALSVTAVLVCIFSCMLAYQLLSHERKKMYWEQLELRCRSLYRAPTLPAATNVQSSCACCAQCQQQGSWDISLQHRFWAPGRVGNLYSPNPGAARKTSAWSWFPWPRSANQNSRPRMSGVPQSGDSAYGFCETDAPQQYDPYPTPQDPHPPGGNRNYPDGFAAQGSFQGQGTFPPQQSYPQQSYPQYEPALCESSSYDAQRGVWGPPPPYSPQGRGMNRHHHQQDPATATLLHHHHIDAHANVHTCPRNYVPNENRDLNRANINRDIARAELNRSDIIRADVNRDMSRSDLNRADMVRSSTEIRNQDVVRASEMMRVNQDILRANPDLIRANPDLLRANSDLLRANPEFGRMMQYSEEMAIQDVQFNTLRGHLVPYRCQRGLSANNLHRDCENVAMECIHQNSASKVSDQSSDSCQKQGKENLGFQNDKHSPIRSSECRGVNQNAESEVYFADVSSCCNVSVKAECCMNNVLVGTIESHPDTTSESEGSFTLTRTHRQPPTTSKRRPKHTHKDKHTLKQEKHTLKPVRLTEHQIEQLNLRMNDVRLDKTDSRDQLNGSRNELDRLDPRISERMNETRLSERTNDRFERTNDCRVSERMSDSRESRMDRLNESRVSERMNDSRDRLNDPRMERFNESRISERLNKSCIDRMNDSRIERMNDRIRLNDSDRLNESRISDRFNELRVSDRMNDSRINRFNESDRMNDSRVNRLNDSDRMNESRVSRLNDSDRGNDSRINRLNESERMNDSRINRSNESERMNERTPDRGRMNESDRMNESRITRLNEIERMSDLINERSDRIDRMSDLNSSFKIDPKVSPMRKKESASPKAEFFVPPPPLISPLSPNTEESLLSDDDRPQVYSNDPESSKHLPDTQYEKEKEILKTNHHHCYSDTNTMDSGWQSGSEKQVTD